VVIDSGVANSNPGLVSRIEKYFSSHEAHVQLLDTPMIIAGGEQAKNADNIERLYQQMWRLGIDRHNVVIAIGGGAVLDAVGYSCATFHRGVRLLRMPSTVLAQNDAGVGVKNGYNALNAKNLIGTFAPPKAVLNDFTLLQSLSQRDRRAGLAEAVKVAAIRNKDFFAWMEDHSEALANFAPESTHYAIKECARLHINQITGAGDPFETGSARPLDYGHWSAHKLEAISNYELRHGEAVAIGMVLDAIYAREMNMLEATECERLLTLLKELGFELWHSALETAGSDGQPEVLNGVEEFRQHLGGQLCITLLSEMGIGKEVNQLHLPTLEIALQRLKNLAQSERHREPVK
jgi:3-dehydroquinate synthase